MIHKSFIIDPVFCLILSRLVAYLVFWWCIWFIYIYFLSIDKPWVQDCHHIFKFFNIKGLQYFMNVQLCKFYLVMKMKGFISFLWDTIFETFNGINIEILRNNRSKEFLKYSLVLIHLFEKIDTLTLLDYLPFKLNHFIGDVLLNNPSLLFLAGDNARLRFKIMWRFIFFFIFFAFIS